MNLPFKRKTLKKSELQTLYESYSFMLRAGETVKAATVLLMNDPSKALNPKALQVIVDGCEAGLKFWEIVKANEFLGPYWRQFEVAERTGKLTDAMERVSKQLSNSSNIKSSIRSAMVYPIILIVMAFAVAGALMVFALPTVFEMMEEYEAEVPVITQLLLDAASFLSSKWYVVILGVTVIVVTWRKLVKGPLAMPVAKFVTKFKVTKVISINTNYACFYQLLNDMVENGSNIVEALRIASSACTNKYIQQQLDECAEQMDSEAISLGEAMMMATTMPSQDRMLIKVGSDSGRIMEILQQLVVRRNAAATRAVDSIASLVSPLAMMVVGVIVCVIVMGVYMPIINLTTAI